ncbi:glucosidase 2 subunit beta-like [Acanthaster planci]|uniref:Glucosidase 2 subunit beta n=1 Tax=Acanthaster planci TaxID=133434 RepID=A0A8B7ZHU5_ACAPL|nr:glucosidase 2 subunit beta-like [Acanthaster planci]XP_022104573.1 glucosidase 2 subunit beta-like [Acanthaster planci]XP_022104574.1 glucosidase 2 subunit beta-like [Acanthaster planci]XP_022104575.1 glucosidase 2 subunit beta-like [Acanthaster planci]XP_022104576.1 glucosidase 2 subunit beta-like [Acanthaster planci]XP_022104578.1 glucosidase 2 subunit beta-like [Acanthaster planci]XP_022104579.1 glucosidase 2 subunit beta-like [Acanthaster planci]XP_022104580.1 glucosidase 2 subunit be
MLIPRLVRRRKTWLFCILALACVCFFFQFMGLHILSSGASQKEQSWYQRNKPHAQARPIIIGVRPSDLPLYQPDVFGRVFCLDFSGKIPLSKVNDDYCDCPGDGSDEPGTDACPNGRFYCLHEKRFIPSGKVNDGMCDCCDGSEEWNQTVSLQKVKDLPESKHVRHAPCSNACPGISDRIVEEEGLKRLGARLKRQYLLAGKDHKRDIYGENGEYHLLSRTCYNHFEDHAHYTVCPFRHIVQEKGDHSFFIGKQPVWSEEAKADGNDILVMQDGDKRSCPNDTKRKTYLHFVCGLRDEVVSVRETEKCIYSLRFLTPAAC